MNVNKEWPKVTPKVKITTWDIVSIINNNTNKCLFPLLLILIIIVICSIPQYALKVLAFSEKIILFCPKIL